MDFKIRYSKSALADLESVLEYWRTNFPSTTGRFGDAFLCVGAQVRNRRGIRKIFHSPYTIYYRIHEAARDDLKMAHERTQVQSTAHDPRRIQLAQPGRVAAQDSIDGKRPGKLIMPREGVTWMKDSEKTVDPHVSAAVAMGKA